MLLMSSKQTKRKMDFIRLWSHGNFQIVIITNTEANLYIKRYHVYKKSSIARESKKSSAERKTKNILDKYWQNKIM